MEETLLISDLHLSERRPGSLELFLRFTSERAPRAGALYILGDLFDAWIGDDAATPLAERVTDALRALSDGGTQVLLMHGNRDFLLGETFAQASGARLIADPWVADLFGTRTLLMHGDSLCTDDPAYQAFRRQVREPGFVAAFLAKPMAERLVIAAEHRRRSGEANSLKPADIMDVNPETVERHMKEHGVTRLIHGHTHRPADHALRVDGRPAERIVLAQWHDDQAELISLSSPGMHRETFTAC
jgi:UDP-2,3-diacylglucosamine hydrolase